MHLGVGEQVDLVNPAPPAGWSFKWSVQGDAEVTSPTPTGALLTAGATAGSVTAMLKIDAGPHHLGHTLATLSFKVIAPSGTTARQNPNQAGLRHLQGYAGVGFKMWINLLPSTVVFSRVQWREHIGLGLATGHFEAENGRIHAPSGQPYDQNQQPTSLLSADWMQVYGVNPPPHGVNWVGQVDTVDTGDHPPAVPAAGGTPASWRASSHKWNIEWKYRVQKANGQYSGEFLLERAMHEATIDTTGKATIAKAGAGPFQKAAAAPTSSC